MRTLQYHDTFLTRHCLPGSQEGIGQLYMSNAGLMAASLVVWVIDSRGNRLSILPCATPEKLHKEAAALQMEAAQATYLLIPRSVYALEQES